MLAIALTLNSFELIDGGEWTIEANVDIIVFFSLVCGHFKNLPEVVGVLNEVPFVKVATQLGS